MHPCHVFSPFFGGKVGTVDSHAYKHFADWNEGSRFIVELRVLQGVFGDNQPDDSIGIYRAATILHDS